MRGGVVEECPCVWRWAELRLRGRRVLAACRWYAGCVWTVCWLRVPVERCASPHFASWGAVSGPFLLLCPLFSFLFVVCAYAFCSLVFSFVLVCSVFNRPYSATTGVGRFLSHTSGSGGRPLFLSIFHPCVASLSLWACRIVGKRVLFVELVSVAASCRSVLASASARLICLPPQMQGGGR